MDTEKYYTGPLETVEFIEDGFVKQFTNQKILILKKSFDETRIAKTHGGKIKRCCEFKEIHTGNTHHYKALFTISADEGNIDVVTSFCEKAAFFAAQLYELSGKTVVSVSFDIQVLNVPYGQKVEAMAVVRSYKTGEHSIGVDIELEYNDGSGLVQRTGVATYEM